MSSQPTAESRLRPEKVLSEIIKWGEKPDMYVDFHFRKGDLSRLD